jgi:hypothetical protein
MKIDHDRLSSDSHLLNIYFSLSIPLVVSKPLWLKQRYEIRISPFASQYTCIYLLAVKTLLVN